MATEGIFKNFVINNPKSIQISVDVLDESERDLRRRTDLYKNVSLTDPDAIRQLMRMRQKCREDNTSSM